MASEPESIPEAVSLWVHAHAPWSGAELCRWKWLHWGQKEPPASAEEASLLLDRNDPGAVSPG